MWLCYAGIANVHHRDAKRHEDVGDHPAMAAPPEHLGAHDRRARSVREGEQLDEPLGELLGLDMIGLASKCAVTPARVRGVGARRSPSTKRGEPTIADAVGFEVGLELCLRESR